MKILLVEDDVEFNALLCKVFTAEKFSVTPVFDSYEALLLLEMEQFDIIVSDVNLGISPSGFELYKKSQSSHAGEFVLYTASSAPGLRELADEYGITNFITNSSNNVKDIKAMVMGRFEAMVKRNTDATNKLLGLQ
jgi:DNA-binding response OmpR family regulator